MKYCHRKRGFTLVELMIVVMIIGIIAEISIPGFFSARTGARIQACLQNLAEIDGAKTHYAMNFALSNGDAVNNAQALVPTYLSYWPNGPVQGTYVANPVGDPPTFNGQDATWYTSHCVTVLDDACPF